MTDQGKFATVELTDRVDLTDWETAERGHDGTHSFDHLIFLPYNYQAEGVDLHVQSVDVYLADSENNIVNLGTLGQTVPDNSRAWKLKLGDQLVTARLDNGKLFVQTR